MSDISEAELERTVTLEIREWIAIITLNMPAKLNSLTQNHFFRIGSLLHEIAAMPEITVTILTGKGRFFSAGADVTVSRSGPESKINPRKYWAQSFVVNNLHNTHAFYTHPKILVTALNGPAIGLSAAVTAHSDFIYAAPHAYLATPFTSLGLLAEGGSSRAFVDRLGISKANEMLFTSRKLACEELKALGYVNKIITQGGGDAATGKGIDTDKFLEAVIAEVKDKLGKHLNHYTMLGMKKLIRKPGMALMDQTGLDEVWGGLDVFTKGIPQQEFEKIANGTKRHKL